MTTAWRRRLERTFRSSPSREDILAGLTVALVGIPQCLAYAMMSGVPPAYGLVTAAVPGLVAAVVGRSPHVVTGPTNTTGLLILGALVPFLDDNGYLASGSLAVLATLTLLAGVLRLVLGLAGGAALLRFLPESVLVGFTAGAGILIGVMQLDEAFGLPPVRGEGLAGEIEGLVNLTRAGHLPSVPALAVTAATIMLITLARRRMPELPMPILAVGSVAVVAWALALDGAKGLPLTQDRAPMPNGWPAWDVPNLSPSLLGQLFLPAAAITLLGTLELAVTSRGAGGRQDMRKEILAQGWANVAGAFSGAFPASASLGRSALLRIGGARTRWAPALAALVVFPVLLFASSLVGHIPQSSLAGVLLVISHSMVDRAAIRRIWRAAPETRLLLLVTWLGALLLPLEWAVVFGAGLGLVIHLARTSAPRVRLLRPEGNRLIPAGPQEGPEVVVMEVSGDLHYAAVEPCLEQAEALRPASARFIVLDLSHAHEMRFTALQAIERWGDELARAGASLRLAGVTPEFSQLMSASGSKLPATPGEAEPGLSVRNALAALPSAGSSIQNADPV
jgi:SulP family sulfate permease